MCADAKLQPKLSKADAIKARTAAIKAARAANKERRKDLSKKVFELKIVENKLFAHQRTMLSKFFLEAKWLVNAIIGSDDPFEVELAPTIPVMVYNPETAVCDIREMRELTLGSQMQQGLFGQVKTDIVNLAKKKAKGQKVGARGFTKEQNCIPLPQAGSTYRQLKNKNYFAIQKIGKVRVSGAEQIKDCYEMAGARLIRRPSGYYLKVLCYVPKVEDDIVVGSKTALDFGCSVSLTDIQGNEATTRVELPKRLRNIQQARSRKYEVHKKLKKKDKKCSNNYIKDSAKIRKIHEKVTNKKKDLVKKIIHLYRKYEMIGMQDDCISGWQAGRHGKTISRSAVGQLKKEFKKLASDKREVIVIDRSLPTTQECPLCLVWTKHEMSQRIFTCSHCGFEEQRDIKGAKCTFCYAEHERVTGQHLRRVGRTPVSVEQLTSAYKHYPFEKTDGAVCKSAAVKQETARLA